ncbi:head GIN domain-containing protein [Undibacterium sp. Ren11W]|uniref:head GIN domain-containing protein n=1 Tax=Undibacterium sp. Ren11W TaxID=3413045 RepID=UPI003BF25CAC
MKNIIRCGAAMLILAIILIAASALFMRAHAAQLNTGVVASSEHRPISAEVVNVVLSGAINLDLNQSPSPQMMVKGDASMLAHITSRVEGNTLYLGTRGIVISIRQPLVVELNLPALEKLQMQGSGDSQVKGFRGNRLELSSNASGNLSFDGEFQQLLARTSGSGDLVLVLKKGNTLDLNQQGSGDARIQGQVNTFNAKLSGSGDLDAKGLKAQQVGIFAYGSSDVSVFAEQEIKVKAMGSGDTTIYGNPAKRSIERHGSGEVSWK